MLIISCYENEIQLDFFIRKWYRYCPHQVIIRCIYFVKLLVLSWIYYWSIIYDIIHQAIMSKIVPFARTHPHTRICTAITKLILHYVTISRSAYVPILARTPKDEKSSVQKLCCKWKDVLCANFFRIQLSGNWFVNTLKKTTILNIYRNRFL